MRLRQEDSVKGHQLPQDCPDVADVGHVSQLRAAGLLDHEHAMTHRHQHA